MFTNLLGWSLLKGEDYPQDRLGEVKPSRLIKDCFLYVRESVID